MASGDRVLPWRRSSAAPAEELAPLLASYRSRHPKASIALINKAYITARGAHQHQLRGSGESYINHPIAVAKIVADIAKLQSWTGWKPTRGLTEIVSSSWDAFEAGQAR